MIKIAHTADLHYGVENYGRVDPKTGIHTRLLDFHNAFSFVIKSAIKEDVDLFIMSGDAYKTAHPTPTQQRLLLENLIRLYHAKIPVVLIVGNHDIPGSFGKSHTLDLFRQLPVDGFHVIAKPELKKIFTKSGPIQIIGIPWPTRNTISLNKNVSNTTSAHISQLISSTVSQAITDLASKLEKETPAILAGHITMSTGIFSGSEKCATTGQDPIFLPSQIIAPGIDYVALGHLHRYQQINPTGKPPIVYSGSIERIDFGEIKDTKGFCLVTIHAKGETSVKHIPTPVRPFVQIETTLTNQKPLTEQLLEEIKKQNIDHAIVKITYTMPAETTDTVDLKAIHAACNKAHHIASITPIHPPKTRNIRARISTQMSTDTALATFLRTQNLSETKIERIQKKLERLIASLENKENTIPEHLYDSSHQEHLHDPNHT